MFFFTQDGVPFLFFYLEKRYLTFVTIEAEGNFVGILRLGPVPVNSQSLMYISKCPGNDAKLIRCVLGMTLNSSVVVQGMTVKLRPCLRFRACG